MSVLQKPYSYILLLLLCITACSPDASVRPSDSSNVESTRAVTNASTPTEPMETAPALATVYIGSKRTYCNGMGSVITCLQMKDQPEDEYYGFDEGISGFRWEAGYEYELQIALVDQGDVADASRYERRLVSVLSKTPVEPLSPVTKQFFVAADSHIHDCNREREADCILLLTETDENGNEHYQFAKVQGFEWENGYEYQLLITVSENRNPKPNESSWNHELVEIIEQSGLPVSQDKRLISGVYWQFVFFDEDTHFEIDDELTMTFLSNGRYKLGGVCAGSNGRYMGEGNRLRFEIDEITEACHATAWSAEFFTRLAQISRYSYEEDYYLGLESEAGSLLFEPRY